MRNATAAAKALDEAMAAAEQAERELNEAMTAWDGRPATAADCAAVIDEKKGAWLQAQAQVDALWKVVRAEEQAA